MASSKKPQYKMDKGGVLREVGTLHLLDVPGHRARAAELRQMADNEERFDLARVLNEAAQVHDDHVLTLQAAASNSCTEVG